MDTYGQLKYYLYTAYVHIMGRRSFEMRTTRVHMYSIHILFIYMTVLKAAIVDGLWIFSLIIYRVSRSSQQTSDKFLKQPKRHVAFFLEVK